MTSDLALSSHVQQKIIDIISHYPAARKRSALIPVLDLVQRECGGWLSVEAMQKVADILDLPYMRVYEVASFYTMFNLKPVGKYHVKVCGTTPCWLRGAADVMQTCKNHLGVQLNETTADGMFTLSEFECLGGCVNAPVVQINDDYIEDLNPEQIIKVLDDLQNGAPLKAFSCTNRQGSKAQNSL